jgi:hypothetical protein
MIMHYISRSFLSFIHAFLSAVRLRRIYTDKICDSMPCSNSI